MILKIALKKPLLGKLILFQYFIFNKFRWCVIDLEWEADDGRKVSKVCLIAFAPDNAASNQDKFLVAANKSTLMQKLKPNANRDF